MAVSCNAGPAPCDPRFWDVDPADLAPYLKAGRNVVAALACAFGNGDGTYVPTAPVGSGEGQGFLFQCDALGLVSDESWKTLRPRCWKHGAPARWFLRALQEEYDARFEPTGWREIEFDDSAWQAAMVSRVPIGRPNLGELGPAGWVPEWRLTPREIPPLVESLALPAGLGAVGRIRWKSSPEEYFECFPPGAFDETLDASVARRAEAPLFPLIVQPPAAGEGIAVTFEFDREIVGHPFVRVLAPEGTVIEVLWVEKQAPGKLLLRGRPRFGQWLRVTCGSGVTNYEAFEYEALRLLQLHIRNAGGPVEIQACGVKERNYDWAHQPEYEVSDTRIKSALDASFRTHKLLCQETIVDNVTRERQQYAGDLDHPKRLSLCAFGETRQVRRVIRTFAQGQNPEGWFMDSWPAWDRCQRLFQKHLGVTKWGAIIDHALEFGIAVADYYLWTADRALLDELKPKLEKYAAFLERSALDDGLLPVAPWTWQSVWIDHIGYKREDEKHCALNLYWAGFLSEGLARLQSWSGAGGAAAASRARAGRIVEAVRARYWSKIHRDLRGQSAYSAGGWRVSCPCADVVHGTAVQPDSAGPGETLSRSAGGHSIEVHRRLARLRAGQHRGGLQLSAERDLAIVGTGARRARRYHRQGLARALGQRAVGERERNVRRDVEPAPERDGQRVVPVESGAGAGALPGTAGSEALGAGLCGI